MMNFVLSKLKSLFDNFNHIFYWRNSLKNTCKRLYNIVLCTGAGGPEPEF